MQLSPEVRFAVFDGNSWTPEGRWFYPTAAGVEIPVALRVYGERLYCVVVAPLGGKLAKHKLNADGTWTSPSQELTLPPGATQCNGVALTGPDLYIAAGTLDHASEKLYVTSATSDDPPTWELVEERQTECRGLISAACDELAGQVRGSKSMARLRARATLTAFRGRAWCAYDTGLASNPLYWQTYADKKWSPAYQFGNMVCGLDPAMCVYGDALYCFHRGEDGSRVRWSATEGLTWSVAHDTPMTAVRTPAVRAFQGKLYCAYVDRSEVPDPTP